MRSPTFAILLGGIISIPVMLHSQVLGALVWVAVIFIQPYLADRLRRHTNRDH